MTRSLRFVLLAMAALVLAAFPACGSRRDQSGAEAVAQTDEDLGTIICGSYPSVDSDGSRIMRPEYYVVHAMNRKLHYFPELAQAVGLHSVKTCDQARAFEAGYATYFKAHPYFDKDMPRERIRPLPPMPKDSEVTVPKVFAGQAFPIIGDDLFPVVEIKALFQGNSLFFNGDPIGGVGDASTKLYAPTSCSGAFVAKNFILTAAHCIERVALQFDPTTPESRDWLTENQWEIDFPDPNNGGVTNSGGRFRLRTWAVSIVNPNFSTVVNNAAGDAGIWLPPGDGSVANPFRSPYDIALLYIPPYNDGNLPANPDTTFAIQLDNLETDIALIPGLTNSEWALAQVGYGPTHEGTPVANPDFLNGNLNQPIFTTPTDRRGVQSTLTSTVDAGPWTNIALCHGDSGGPLFRQVSPSFLGGQLVDKVIVAVASSIRPTNPDGEVGDCAGGFGETSQWARVDVVSAWLIESVQQLLNGSTWQPTPIPDSISPSSYTFLHGPGCQSDCDCALTHICFNPITDPSSPFAPGPDQKACNACASPPDGQPCGCVMGQCIEPPDPVDAGNILIPNSCVK